MQVHVCMTVCVHAQVISMLVFPTYSHTHILLTQLTCCSKQYTLPSPQSLSPASSSPATPTKSAKFATMPPLSPVTHGKTDTSPSRELQRWRTAAKRDCYIDINMLTAIQLARQVGWLVVCVCVCVCVCVRGGTWGWVIKGENKTDIILFILFSSLSTAYSDRAGASKGNRNS